MKKGKSKDLSEADTMRDEYDFRKMRVYRRGPGRRRSETVLHVTIDDDVRCVFPDAAAVNEGLRLLIRLNRDDVKTHETLNPRSQSQR